MRVEPGDAVLLGEREALWAGCLLRVEEVKGWGVVGRVVGAGGAVYPLRVATADIAAVFRVVSLPSAEATE